MSLQEDTEKTERESFDSSRRKALKTGGLVGLAGLIAASGMRGEFVSQAASPDSKKVLFNSIKPEVFVTVSAIGKSQTGIVNDGADFGPDTKGTVTNGIQEALNSIASSGGLVYCVNNGTYTIAGSIFTTGDNQVLYFEAGCTLNVSASGSFNGGGLFFPFSDGSSRNFNYVKWIGNGTTVNTNAASSFYAVFNCSNVSYSTADSCTIDGLLEDFDVTDVVVTGLALGCGNAAGFNPTFEECMREVTLRGIQIAWSSSTPGYPAGFYILGSARQILVEDCVGDQSQIYGGADTCFVRSQYGNVSRVTFRRCYFLSNYSPVELQGSDNSGGSGVTTEYIKFEECEFAAPSSSSAFLYIDDDYNSSNYSYVNNVDFLKCRFTNCTVLFGSQAPSNSSLPYGWPLGYIRFVDCDLGGLTWSSFASGSLANRSPGQGVNISSFFSKSGTTYTNGELAAGLGGDVEVFDQTIVVSGGSGVSISLDGQPTGVASGAFILRAGHSITIGYSSSPSVYLFPL